VKCREKGSLCNLKTNMRVGSIQAERPTDWANCNLLGSIHIRLGRFAEARPALEKAQALAND
jgi:Flp pilus assembly protein TadD